VKLKASVILSASLLLLHFGIGETALAQGIACSMSAYHETIGLTAEQTLPSLTVTWTGDKNTVLRLQFEIDHGTPTIDDLSLRQEGKAWVSIASNLVPEFTVVTGVRRISNQQLEPLAALHVPLTASTISKYRWDAFWDAPLDLSDPQQSGPYSSALPPRDGISAAGQPGLPRKPSEIEHSKATYNATSCRVISDGLRLIVEFPGVQLGVFSGVLRYTVFRGTNLIRQEIVGQTDKQWVAYKYDAGLTGFPIDSASRVAWRDPSNSWRQDRLRAGVNPEAVPLRARNRVVAAQQGAGSIAAFPPPHKFFWSRESAVNLGHNWVRKDSDMSFSFGIRQSEHEDYDHPEFLANWALYNARPGTDQLMTVFFYPSLGEAEDAIDQSMAFTHHDTYKPLPGFQVMNHHYHMEMGSRLLREGSPAAQLDDLLALKALGLTIVSPVDALSFTAFDEAGEPLAAKEAPESLKRREQQNQQWLAITAMSIAAAKVQSDDRFLILPSQEIYNGPFGGHTDLLFSHPVYWDERRPGQPLADTDPKFGKMYHIGSAEDLMTMVRAEGAIIAMPHPRSKGSTGFPDAIKDRTPFEDPSFFGFGARWGMGLDGSERRLCDYRCWPLLDDISNWVTDKAIPLKKILSISEAMAQSAEDDIYASAPVTYLQLAELPAPEDVSTVINALKNDYSFWTTGEVLAPSFELRGKGAEATIVADVEWTFPLDFVEVIWGDGTTTGRKIVSTTDLPPFGKQRFEIPFDARGKKWVRFAAWDIASDGAVLQPIRIPTK